MYQQEKRKNNQAQGNLIEQVYKGYVRVVTSPAYSMLSKNLGLHTEQVYLLHEGFRKYLEDCNEEQQVTPKRIQQFFRNSIESPNITPSTFPSLFSSTSLLPPLQPPQPLHMHLEVRRDVHTHTSKIEVEVQALREQQYKQHLEQRQMWERQEIVNKTLFDAIQDMNRINVLQWQRNESLLQDIIKTQTTTLSNKMNNVVYTQPISSATTSMLAKNATQERDHAILQESIFRGSVKEMAQKLLTPTTEDLHTKIPEVMQLSLPQSIPQFGLSQYDPQKITQEDNPHVTQQELSIIPYPTQFPAIQQAAQEINWSVREILQFYMISAEQIELFLQSPHSKTWLGYGKKYYMEESQNTQVIVPGDVDLCAKSLCKELYKLGEISEEAKQQKLDQIQILWSSWNQGWKGPNNPKTTAGGGTRKITAIQEDLTNSWKQWVLGIPINKQCTTRTIPLCILEWRMGAKKQIIEKLGLDKDMADQFQKKILWRTGTTLRNNLMIIKQNIYNIDRRIHNLPIKKNDEDTRLPRPCSLEEATNDIIITYKATSLKKIQRNSRVDEYNNSDYEKYVLKWLDDGLQEDHEQEQHSSIEEFEQD